MMNQGTCPDYENFPHRLRVIPIEHLVDVWAQAQVVPHAPSPVGHVAVIPYVENLELPTYQLPVLEHGFPDLLVRPLQLGKAVNEHCFLSKLADHPRTVCDAQPDQPHRNAILVIANLLLDPEALAQASTPRPVPLQLPAPTMHLALDVEIVSPLQHIAEHPLCLEHIAVPRAEEAQQRLCLTMQRPSPACRMQLAILQNLVHLADFEQLFLLDAIGHNRPF
mmetsp:Transcript_16620/g.31428  ORF Transcript_16620/g.31428 Transcript_16620/m.31428 type:complete len:222 (+) Transcript_16620:553-1218(+)